MSMLKKGIKITSVNLICGFMRMNTDTKPDIIKVFGYFPRRINCTELNTDTYNPLYTGIPCPRNDLWQFIGELRIIQMCVTINNDRV
jgi:hypothetical protein